MSGLSLTVLMKLGRDLGERLLVQPDRPAREEVVVGFTPRADRERLRHQGLRTFR